MTSTALELMPSSGWICLSTRCRYTPYDSWCLRRRFTPPLATPLAPLALAAGVLLPPVRARRGCRVAGVLTGGSASPDSDSSSETSSSSASGASSASSSSSATGGIDAAAGALRRDGALEAGGPAAALASTSCAGGIGASSSPSRGWLFAGSIGTSRMVCVSDDPSVSMPAPEPARRWMSSARVRSAAMKRRTQPLTTAAKAGLHHCAM